MSEKPAPPADAGARMRMSLEDAERENMVDEFVTDLRTENDALAARVKALAVEVAMLRVPRICSICAGTAAVNGKPCICDDGSERGEMVGLRIAAQDSEARVKALTAALREIRALRTNGPVTYAMRVEDIAARALEEEK